MYLSLEQAAKKIREKFNAMPQLRNNGLSFEQWLIVELIGKNPGINQKKIIEILLKEPASVSRMVKKLIERNILIKKKDELDKKVMKLFLTKKGQIIFDDFKKNIDKEFKEIFSGIYERELYLMIDVLKRL